MLELTSLRLLQRFATEGSVARAASVLGVGPSVVLQGLAALERETGMSLIERTARGVALNEVGVRYAERAAAVLAELERISEADLVPSEHRLLVVDDDPMHLELITSMLAEVGYRVTACQHAARALEAALDQPPDLVLLDVVLDGADGFEVTRRLRSTAELREVPVLFVSGSSFPETERLAEELSGTAHLDKPVVHERLLAAVEAQLRERVLARELRRNPLVLGDEEPWGGDGASSLDGTEVEGGREVAGAPEPVGSPVAAGMAEAAGAEEAAVDHGRLLAVTLAMVTDLVWIRDVEGRVVGASPGFAALLGVEADAVGLTLPDGALAGQLDAWHAACLEGQDLLRWEGEVTAADGATHHLDVRVTIVRDAAGTPIGAVGTARPVTAAGPS